MKLSKRNKNNSRKKFKRKKTRHKYKGGANCEFSNLNSHLQRKISKFAVNSTGAATRLSLLTSKSIGNNTKNIELTHYEYMTHYLDILSNCVENIQSNIYIKKLYDIPFEDMLKDDIYRAHIIDLVRNIPLHLSLDLLIKNIIHVNGNINDKQLRDKLTFNDDNTINSWILYGLNLIQLPELFGFLEISHDLWLNNNQLATCLLRIVQCGWKYDV